MEVLDAIERAPTSSADLELSAGRQFDKVASGAMRIAIGQRYPLTEAGQAHSDLEGRKTTGATVLKP